MARGGKSLLCGLSLYFRLVFDNAKSNCYRSWVIYYEILKVGYGGVCKIYLTKNKLYVTLNLKGGTAFEKQANESSACRVRFIAGAARRGRRRDEADNQHD